VRERVCVYVTCMWHAHVRVQRRQDLGVEALFDALRGGPEGRVVVRHGPRAAAAAVVGDKQHSAA